MQYDKNTIFKIITSHKLGFYLENVTAVKNEEEVIFPSG